MLSQSDIFKIHAFLQTQMKIFCSQHFLDPQAQSCVKVMLIREAFGLMGKGEYV